MTDLCKYCGSPLAHCPVGEYCTNEKCSYADGIYRGPRVPRNGQPNPIEAIEKLEERWRRLSGDFEYEGAASRCYFRCAEELAALIPALKEKIRGLELALNAKATEARERTAERDAAVKDRQAAVQAEREACVECCWEPGMPEPIGAYWVASRIRARGQSDALQEALAQAEQRGYEWGREAAASDLAASFGRKQEGK